MYATVSLPPVPVLHVLAFQHLSARARLTFLSARPRPASAMLRDVGFFGSSVALKSVFLSVVAFALYTSPYPPPLPMMTGAAALAWVLPVLPRPVETITRPAASSTSARTAATDPFRFMVDFRRCISLLLSRASARVWLHARVVVRPSLDRPQDAAEERGDPVAGDQHPDDNRSTENDELHPRPQTLDHQQLGQERECERRHPGRRRARQPARERRARDHDGGDRSQQVRSAELRGDADADAGEQDRSASVEDPCRRVRED